MRRPLALALLLAACGDNRDPIDDLPGDPDAGAAGRTLTGDQVASFRALDGSEHGQAPADLWETVVEAHVPDPAADDGWRVVPGVGHRDGSFAIEGVPEEPVWLRLARRPAGDVFYWTDADHVGFDEIVLGPESPPGAAEGDQLLLDVDGLAPWQAGDGLAWLVPDDVVFDLDLVQLAPPAEGATAVDGAVDWTWRSLAHADAGEGYLVQYRQSELAGLPVLMPVRAATPPLTQTAGEDATLAATLAAPPPLAFRLAWARDAFEAERAAIHPERAGASWWHGLSVTAFPGIVDGDVWIAPEYPLVQVSDATLLQGTDLLDLGDVEVPNPFPRGWITASFVVTFPIDLPMPDGSPFTLEATIFTRDTALPSASAPATPAITPARAPTIGGVDAHADLDGVGLTPELAWTPPATGDATAYQVQIIEAVEDPPFPYAPGWYLAAELWVSGDRTSLRVPHDVLRAGVTYAAVIRAHAQPGQDIATRPFRTGAVAAFADTVLGRFTP